MNFDKENIADDDRNNMLSDRARELDELRYRHYQLMCSMESIKEVWTGSDGTKINTEIELYLERICRQMYLLASEALLQDKIS